MKTYDLNIFYADLGINDETGENEWETRLTIQPYLYEHDSDGLRKTLVATFYATEAESEDDVFELDAAAELVDDEADEAPLLPENTTSSMRESLAALAMLAEPGVAPQIVRSGETSLEGLTRELLRPALAEWLDKNLPPLVERMVAAEIARIVGKKG